MADRERAVEAAEKGRAEQRAAQKRKRRKIIEELTRSEIVAAAAAVVQREGRERLTMERVAAEAGLAKGTLYLYFTNKQEMLDGLIAATLKPLEEEQSRILEAELDFLWKLEQFASASLQYAHKNRVLFRELHERLFSTSEQYVNNSGWYWNAINLLNKAFDEARTHGRIREVDTLRISILFMGAINTLMARQILSPVTESVESEVAELMELFSSGILG